MHDLLTTITGEERAESLLTAVAVPSSLADPEQPRGQASRTTVAMALALVLFDDLLARVPSGKRYVARERERGRKVVYDHGAVRTVDWPETGGLPSGGEVFRRFLVPLGYEEVGLYPLDRIRMTGRVFSHRDLPEDLPQYFVSELHVDRLPAEAQDAVTHVVGESVDPLTDEALGLADELAQRGWLSVADAAHLVSALAPCFGRHHSDPALADYDTLLRHSAEMAWIATEGNAFNHATDRVADVDTLADELRADGWPMKDTVERSRSGRVRQTATRADTVTRTFRDEAGGSTVEREVPGSFFEYISRDPLPGGLLDLTFDAGNAQGIFTMTRE